MAQFNITVNLDWLDEEENLDEKLKDEILSGIVSKVGENITKSLESEARELLDKRMAGLESEIGEKLNSIMQEFFNTPKDITDRYGNVAKRGVTVTQLLTKSCDDFLSQSVNERGEPASGYGVKYNTRIDYIVHKTIDNEMEWAIKRAVEDVTKNLKQKVSTEIKAQMGEKLAGIVGLDKIISG